ncbi:hypothetical protein FOL47_008205 [Perkinsus chesapeaki]|uniref:PPPDE domain-containing protein n=1 Tax=Perkinsus chesapeaki TaxID=330153 RepID=A0A7J6LG96_PERCH|nr:hypothetical protein FOL47_008205 [Perkinsus chesapeaki]
MRRPLLQVTVNVYDLAESNVFFPCCGAHHTGVEIMGREYSFAKGEGVYDCQPGEAPEARFKIAIDMGRTSLTMRQIDSALDRLRDEFRGDTYNIVKRNCNHFSDALCRAVLGRPLPSWINRLAWWGSWCACCIPDDDEGDAATSAGAGSSGQPLLPAQPPSQQLFSGHGRTVSGGTGNDGVLGRLMSYLPHGGIPDSRPPIATNGDLATASGDQRELRLHAIEMRQQTGAISGAE